MASWRHKLIVAVCTISAACGVIVLSAATASAVPVPAPSAAASTDLFRDVCTANGASGSAVCSASGANNLSGPNGIIIKVANIFAFVAGVAAVIVIMIGGFTYITAAGDAGKASGGRNTVIYASIGLVVIVVGRAVIGFVILRFK